MLRTLLAVLATVPERSFLNILSLCCSTQAAQFVNITRANVPKFNDGGDGGKAVIFGCCFFSLFQTRLFFILLCVAGERANLAFVARIFFFFAKYERLSVPLSYRLSDSRRSTRRPRHRRSTATSLIDAVRLLRRQHTHTVERATCLIELVNMNI